MIDELGEFFASLMPAALAILVVATLLGLATIPIAIGYGLLRAVGLLP